MPISNFPTGRYEADFTSLWAQEEDQVALGFDVSEDGLRLRGGQRIPAGFDLDAFMEKQRETAIEWARDGVTSALFALHNNTPKLITASNRPADNPHQVILENGSNVMRDLMA